jgi:WD40 repeat protein
MRKTALTANVSWDDAEALDLDVTFPARYRLISAGKLALLLTGSVGCMLLGWFVVSWIEPMARPLALVEKEQRRHGVRALAFHPNGDQLAAGREDGVLHVWDLAETASSYALEGPQSGIRSLAFSPDGAYLAVAGGDSGKQLGELYVWSLAARKIVAVPGPQSGPVGCLAFHPSGAYLVVGGAAGTLQVLETSTWTIACQVQAHRDEVLALHYSPDGRRLVTGSCDQHVRVWEFPGLREVAQLAPRLGAVRGVAFSPDGQTIAMVGGENSDLATWHVTSGRTRRAATGMEGLRALAFHPDGRWLAIASGTWPRGGSTRVLDTVSLRPRLSWSPTDGVAYCVAHAPDGLLVASGEADGRVRVRDAVTGEVLGLLH